MRPDTISLRRRHLMTASVVGAVTPATVFARQWGVRPDDALQSPEQTNLVVSGRIVGAADGKPLASATVELWHADAAGNRAIAITDGDGRFFTTIAPARYAGRPRRIHYRVNHQKHATQATQLYFTPERGISSDRVTQLQRDDEGTWRATFGATVVA